MQSTRKSLKGLSLALLAGTMLVSSTALHSNDATQALNIRAFVDTMCSQINDLSWTTKAALLTAFATVFRYNMKAPSNDPARYDFSKLDTKTLLNNQKEFFIQLWYVLDDGVIGRSGSSSSPKAKQDEKGKITIVWSPSAKPQGFGGKVHDCIVHPLAKTLSFPVKLTTTLGAIAASVLLWKQFVEGTEVKASA